MHIIVCVWLFNYLYTLNKQQQQQQDVGPSDGSLYSLSKVISYFKNILVCNGTYRIFLNWPRCKMNIGKMHVGLEPKKKN